MAEVIVVAAICIHDGAGRLLTVRKRGTHRFMLPGGKLEPGETPELAVVRETAEEVGIVVALDGLVLLGEWRAPAANEPDTYIDSTVFTADVSDPRPVVAGEIEELRWVDRGAASALEVAPLAAAYFLPEA